MTYQSERSLEQRYSSAVAGLYARLRSNYDALHEKYGDEGLKLIAEMSRRYGREVAARARGRFDGGDITSVGRYLARIFETVGGEFEVNEADENRLVIRGFRCPLDFDNPEMCLAHTEMEKTVVEELGPGLTYHIGKSIPKGDPYCEHIIEIKPAARS